MRQTYRFDTVDDEQISPYFTTPFNPPAISNEAFDKEYNLSHELVRMSIEKIGGICDPIDGNFVMNDTHGPSRWISIDLINEQLADARLVPSIMDALLRAPKEYAVYISHECPETSLFHVIVFRDHVVASKSKSDWLAQILKQSNT